MSKTLIGLNVVLAGVAVLLGVWLVRDLAAARPLPSATRKAATPIAAPAPEPAAPENAAQDRLAAYNVIVAKYLFSPTRTEGGTETAAKPAVPLPPKPILLGVVVDPSGSRAYLEDPTTKRVFGYQVGDSIAGGKLEKIVDDRVQISRPDGLMDVILRDPTKPRPVAPTPAPNQPGQPGQPVQPPRPAPPQFETPAGARPPVPPRSLRRAPNEQAQTEAAPQPPAERR